MDDVTYSLASENLALMETVERIKAAGDALVAAIRNHDLREEHLKAWEEARRG